MLNQGVKERSKSDVLEQNHLAAASNKPRSESYPPTCGGGVESEQAQSKLIIETTRQYNGTISKFQISLNGSAEISWLILPLTTILYVIICF